MDYMILILHILLLVIIGESRQISHHRAIADVVDGTNIEYVEAPDPPGQPLSTGESCRRVRSGLVSGDEQIESCLHLGYKFLRKYIRQTRIKKSHGNTKCNLFHRFQSCFAEVTSKCSGNSSLLLPPRESLIGHDEQSADKHDLLDLWSDVVKHVTCLCDSHADCDVDAACVFTELDGFWGRRCDDLYNFNVMQQTKHNCLFFDENVQCKTALVSTACTEDSARFASSVLYLTSGNETYRLPCTRGVEKKQHRVFSYSGTCKRQLIQDIDNCSALFKSENIVEFYEDNDLIPQDNKKLLKTACRTVQKFTDCLVPLRKVCSDGVEKVLDYQEDLRRYILKMNYICSDSVFSDFKKNLRCYQSIMENGTLRQCSGLWKSVIPWQEKINSYQFYCQPTHDNSLNLVKELNVVGDCHQETFNHQCGTAAALHIRQLFDLAFRDPYYLRLTYKPDCSLHHPDPEVSAPVSPTTSTSSSRDSSLRQSSAFITTTVSASSSKDSPGTRVTSPPHHRKGGGELGLDGRSISGAAGIFYNIWRTLTVALILLSIILL